MSDAENLVLAVLQDIRDEARGTNERLERVERTLNERIGSVEDTLNTRLGHVEETLVELAEQQRFVVKWLRAGAARDRDLGREVDQLRSRVDVIEERLDS